MYYISYLIFPLSPDYHVSFDPLLCALDTLANRVRTFVARHERFRSEAAALLVLRKKLNAFWEEKNNAED